MENCLFVQWKKPTDASRYVIDGNPCEYSGTEQQNKIMKLFAGVPKFKEICSKKNREDLSPSFRCSYYRNKSSILHFIEGNFEETDFAGRNLVYIFMTSEEEPMKAVEILKEYSSLLGVTPHHEDLEVIKTQLFKKKSIINLVQPYNKLLIWTIITILISLLLYMLLNLQSKELTTNGTPEQTALIEMSSF